MNTCKTCKWWVKKDRAYSSGSHTVCDCVDNIHVNSDESFELYAEALDDSGLAIELVTGPNFGCIHWEEKKK